MKIYTSVVMQWDEKKKELVEVSSESYEYKGDLALCGKSPKYHLKKGVKSPGYHATMLSEGDSGRYGYQHPGYVPSDWGRSYAGVDSPAGKQVDVGNLPSVDPADFMHLPTSEYETYTDSQGQQQRRRVGQPRGEALESAWEDYSEQFQEKWYQPFQEAAIDEPVQEAYEHDYTTAQDISGAQEGGGIFSQSQLADLAAAGATSDRFGTESVILPRDVTGEVRTAAEAVESGRTDFQTAMEEAEEEDIKRRDEALYTKEQAERKANLQRQDILAQDLPEAQQREAAIAKTGMAYSAPAETKARLSAGEREKALGEIAKGKKDIGVEYGKATDEIAEARTEEEEAAREEWDLVAEDYGRALMGMGDTVGQHIGKMTDYLSSITDSYKQFGKEMGTASHGQALGVNLTGGRGKFGYRFRNTGDYGDIYQHAPTVGGEAPAGGYFGEVSGGFGGGAQSGLEGIRKGYEDRDALENLKRHITGQTATELSEGIARPEGYDEGGE